MKYEADDQVYSSVGVAILAWAESGCPGKVEIIEETPGLPREVVAELDRRIGGGQVLIKLNRYIPTGLAPVVLRAANAAGVRVIGLDARDAR